ncbi:hypothetical protein F2P81_004641 [Scophthalmus maximus]|uniref:Uncharacterized protein n=1 Tax=Scophthalmus maximus TaxID=52904 RepID=A0A6A4TJC1_SCOMX|nr:hypothetical protein F2P81_004641 [Scophthalmus maximus]
MARHNIRQREEGRRGERQQSAIRCKVCSQCDTVLWPRGLNSPSVSQRQMPAHVLPVTNKLIPSTATCAIGLHHPCHYIVGAIRSNRLSDITAKYAKHSWSFASELKEAICPQLNMHDNRRIDSAFKSCPISE